MSRIGKAPVQLPKGVKVAIDGQRLTVEGPLGKLEHRVHPAQEVLVEERVEAQLDALVLELLGKIGRAHV